MPILFIYSLPAQSHSEVCHVYSIVNVLWKETAFYRCEVTDNNR